MLRRSGVAAAVLSGILLIGTAVPSLARDRGCENRVRKAEQNLHKEIQRHGEHSKQARQRREQLERERANCRVNDHDRRDHDRNYHDQIHH